MLKSGAKVGLLSVTGKHSAGKMRRGGKKGFLRRRAGPGPVRRESCSPAPGVLPRGAEKCCLSSGKALPLFAESAGASREKCCRFPFRYAGLPFARSSKTAGSCLPVRRDPAVRVVCSVRKHGPDCAGGQDFLMLASSRP